MTVRVIHATERHRCCVCGRPNTPVVQTPVGRAHLCARDFADTWPEIANSKQKAQPIYWDLDSLHEQADQEDAERAAASVMVRYKSALQELAGTTDPDEEIYRYGDEVRRMDHREAADGGH